jgi:hypothetical protein
MNNCGGKGDVKQTAEKSKSVGMEYTGMIGVDQVILEMVHFSKGIG